MARKDGDHIRRERTHLDVGGTFAKFESADDRVGDNPKSEARDLRSATKVVGISLDDDFFVLGLRNKSKWAGADWVAREIGAGVVRNDADGGACEIPEE